MRGRLARLFGGRSNRPDALISGVVQPDKAEWPVTWVSAGAVPAPIQSASLGEAVARATDAVSFLYSEHGPIHDATRQLAIYPWAGRAGLIFDADGIPGAYRARDVQGSVLSVAGATIEDIVAAIPGVAGDRAPESMLRWEIPIASLPVSGQGS